MLSVVRHLSWVAVALAAGTVAAEAQTVRRPSTGGGREDSTSVTLSLVVGSQRLDEVKKGRCTHAPQASIYGTLAAMWSVQYSSSSSRSLSLSVWRPQRGDSTAQMNLHISDGSATQRIATVKGTQTLGDGTVRVTKNGPGGRFDITGKTAEGAPVRGYIACEKFSAPMAVGGN